MSGVLMATPIHPTPTVATEVTVVKTSPTTASENATTNQFCEFIISERK